MATTRDRPADLLSTGARLSSRRAAIHPAGARRPTATAAFACAAMLVSYLPFSAVNGALGAIGEGAHATPGDLQWVTDAFTVALTAALLFGGTLAERHGRRRITLVGLGLTSAGSSVGWLSGGVHGLGPVHWLWAGQGLAGAGGGLVMAATLSLVAATATTPVARARGIAVWAAANVVSLGAGPFVAAAATAARPDVGGWRWLFAPIAGLAVLVAAFGVVAAREVANPSASRPDLRSQVLGTVGVLALVSGVIQSGGRGPTSTAGIALLGAGGLLLAAFLVLERRAAHPVVSPRLFASAGFSGATLAAAAVLFTVIGVVFVSSLAFAGEHVDSLGIALRIGCLFLGNAVASVVSGPLQARFDPRRVLLGGLLVTAAGLLTLLLPTSVVQLPDIGWRLFLTGAGCGAVVATSTAVALQSVPAELAGMAGTANNVVRQLGAALGAAVVGGVLQSRLADGADLADATRTCVAFLLVVVAATSAATAALFSRHRRTR